ncbi:thermonuclease family protein [Thalassomonas sp. M1454]|uniref:thermonuclease family protein n=1 Tax=Thalassomonas sp. M1454 TaxID=2594477 RepID=UPI00117C1F51|nr:thermonuclease family protein [Thalassomonas sp. M1454]TRX55802.1 thermonuclease family protein [Thalassomonas sp. M1454]
MKKYSILAALIILVVIIINYDQETTPVVQYKVVKVLDGDSVMIADKDSHRVVELAYIDTPELDQQFGIEAKKWLLEQITGNNSFVEIRAVANSTKVVLLADGVNLNRTLVVLGYAWLDSETKQLPQTYLQDFKRVQDNKIMLWSLPEYQRIPPWIWREDSLL